MYNVGKKWLLKIDKDDNSEMLFVYCVEKNVVPKTLPPTPNVLQKLVNALNFNDKCEILFKTFLEDENAYLGVSWPGTTILPV